jgi:hypothetical protein
MLLEKRTLTIEDLDRQAGFELPDRDMMALVNIIVFDLIDGGILNNLNIEVKNNNVAVQVCAVVNALSSLPSVDLACTVGQG